MSDDGFLAGIALGAIVMGVVFDLMLFGVLDASESHTEIIKHNCAQYNPTTGDFQWNETPPQQ